ncbi:Extracellular serine proteinase [Fibrisoma limi BUZ 3]|uniref:Extracellular serine proteinase n=1 Tax=Fibrisoma limi BUZ 3 TaxID=1185876 RepID=I2GRG6_9BACT|nr:S8 family serine peptidase [Fibrisoma limi]CCH56494.1 Extracellular serine proteinase [Fibrisoma limi BUZ 3]
MSHFSKSALVGLCLPLLLASCQVNEPVAVSTNTPVPNDLVRYSSGDASGRASADEDLYIVTLKEDASLADLLPEQSGAYETRLVGMRGLIARLAGSDLAQRAKQIYVSALKGFAVSLTPKEVAILQRLPFVESVEPDQTIQLRLPGGGVTAQAQTTPWGITRIGGAVNYTGSNVAWVIDTGIDLDHPDLNVSQTRGRSFISTEPTPDDLNGHGTHVAGTIAARNNTVGVVGVAAGATVIPIKVLSGSGSGSNAGVIAGVDYVAANGRAGDVANMSLGGGISSALDNAVLNASNKGIYFALAAGNESRNANNSSPGRVNGSRIYTVSAFDSNNRFASFSNYGNPPIDISAPGVSIQSTYKNGSYATLSGTSMATPHVAGILLANAGRLYYSGTVTGDPDGNPDRRAVR